MTSISLSLLEDDVYLKQRQAPNLEINLQKAQTVSNKVSFKQVDAQDTNSCEHLKQKSEIKASKF